MSEKAQIATVWMVGVAVGNTPDDITPEIGDAPPGLLNNVRTRLQQIRNDMSDGDIPGTERLDKPYMPDESLTDAMQELEQIAKTLNDASIPASIAIPYSMVPVFATKIVDDGHTDLYAGLITKTKNNVNRSYIIAASPEKELAQKLAAEEARKVWSGIRPDSFESCSFAVVRCPEDKTLMTMMIGASKFAVPQAAENARLDRLDRLAIEKEKAADMGLNSSSGM